MISFKTASTLLATAAVLSLAPISNAEAAIFGFQNITGGDSAAGDVYVNQFSVDVTQFGGGVLFKVLYGDAGPLDSFIGSFNVDDADGIGGTNAFFNTIEFNSGNSSTGVNYNVIAAQNFPQGNNLSPSFESDFSAIRDQGAGNTKAINPDEFGSFFFTLKNTTDFNAVIAAIGSGDLRVGLHVQGLPSVNGKDSDSFVNSPTPVPTPALLPGLIGMGVAALRKRKGEAEESAEA